jgi:hypothetical protein
MSSAPEKSSHSELPPAVRIGHVNLRVADGNGIELYYDRPREEWGGPQGRAVRSSRPIGGGGSHHLVPIHRSAWKRNSANFACCEFCEVRDSH